MAMDGLRLGSGMVTNIQAIPGISITNVTELTAFCQAIGKAIVTEITGNADVVPAGHVGSLQNDAGQGITVTSGPGAGSAGTTSAPQTIIGKGAIQ